MIPFLSLNDSIKALTKATTFVFMTSLGVRNVKNAILVKK
jgi:hypothetical protein